MKDELCYFYPELDGWVLSCLANVHVQFSIAPAPISTIFSETVT